MATKNSKFHLAAVIVAALGLGCASGHDEEQGQPAGGINYSVGATDETRDATGISAWTVVPVDDNTLAVAALDVNNQQVATLVIRSTDSEYTIDASGDISGRLSMTADGQLIENTIDDVTILARFHEDGLLELDAAGFRTTGAECATGAAGAGLDCGQFLLGKNPMQLLKCGVSVVGAGLTCYDWWQGDGNQNGQGGQEGGNQGGQDGNGQDDGPQDGGNQDGGGYEDGGGYDDGGGMDGGGYDDGGGMDGGGYEGGGGMDGGGYEGGGYEGGGMDGGGYEGGGYEGGGYEGGGYEGGGEGGYGEGGYGEGGYGEGGYGGYGGEGGYGGYGGGGYGGYGGGGYGYAPRSRQQMAPSPSRGEIPSEASVFSFSNGGAANGPVPLSAWNLTMNKRARAK